MQLREFLPRILDGDLIETLRKARATQTGMLPLKWRLRLSVLLLKDGWYEKKIFFGVCYGQLKKQIAATL